MAFIEDKTPQSSNAVCHFIGYLLPRVTDLKSVWIKTQTDASKRPAAWRGNLELSHFLFIPLRNPPNMNPQSDMEDSLTLCTLLLSNRRFMGFYFEVLRQMIKRAEKFTDSHWNTAASASVMLCVCVIWSELLSMQTPDLDVTGSEVCSLGTSRAFMHNNRVLWFGLFTIKRAQQTCRRRRNFIYITYSTIVQCGWTQPGHRLERWPNVHVLMLERKVMQPQQPTHCSHVLFCSLASVSTNVASSSSS